MYKVEATVTTFTPTELKLTADWPRAWLQAQRSTTIERKLYPGEPWDAPAEPVQRSEIGGYLRRNHPDLQLGDRVIVGCY